MDIFAQQSAYFQIYTKLEDEDEALVYEEKLFPILYLMSFSSSTFS